MSRSDLAGDGQPEPAAPASCVLHAVERLEDSLQLVRWNAGAVVLHADANRICTNTDGHGAARLVVSQRVVDQVAEERRQELRLAGDRHAGFRTFVAEIDLQGDRPV